MNTAIARNEYNKRLSPLEQLLQCSSIIVDNPRSHSTVASWPCHFSGISNGEVKQADSKKHVFDRWTPFESSPTRVHKAKLGKKELTTLPSTPSLVELCGPRRRSSWPATRDFDRWSPKEEPLKSSFQSSPLSATTVDDSNARLPRRKPSLCNDDEEDAAGANALSRVDWNEIQALL